MILLYEKMKNIVYLTICIFLYGCASVRVDDLSKESKYSSYVGHEYALKSNALLCKDGYLGDAPAASPKGNQLILKETEETCHSRKPVTKIKAGTNIRIDKVQMHRHFPPMWRHIYFLGSVKLPNNTVENFYYFYGFDSETVEGKLPW